ncbi:ABC transporter substrate-binding protein [Agrilactobacillus fermenti]|uniref:ABC transporter substrate-binding protein n=1 Tax=Agrilactobacillus fermenti TaxID=2586909 RepID=UPI001E4B93F8|nr:ABC transporter substrate-binding protein [Agrilactobacillus fermenti]MCD2255658.1 ABC transporter substrate-binding protein [Agrilactobacillus fermenti]
MKQQTKFFVFVTLLMGLVLGASGKQSVQAATHQVTDLTGAKVAVPTKVTRVADLWHANNQVVLLLGGPKKLVATTPMIQKMPWYQTVYPKINKVTAPYNGTDLQVEELLKQKPDIVLAADPGTVQKAKAAKLPVANIMFQDFAGLKQSVTVTGQILGGQAPKIAKTYLKDLNHNIHYVKDRVKGSKKIKVLHVVAANNLLKVDGTHSMIDEWLKIAGGTNAIRKSGNMITTTPEEIAKSDPDVIIVGQTTSKQALAVFQKDPRFANLKAVRNKKVYGNPQGTFPWDRYSAEAALQVLWAGKLLHPQDFKTLNMRQETQKFYQKYYHYQLSKTQAEQILAGKQPKS